MFWHLSAPSLDHAGVQRDNRRGQLISVGYLGLPSLLPWILAPVRHPTS